MYLDSIWLNYFWKFSDVFQLNIIAEKTYSYVDPHIIEITNRAMG
jgi:hypothetical protein